ncbi:MAG: HAD family hydrolase [Clostridia bacterium]|nr:HAD family hydrolase [Clostridia bacterium]
MLNYIFDLYGTLVDIHTDEQSARFKKRFAKYFKTIDGNTDFFKEYFSLCADLAKLGGETYEFDLLQVFEKLAGADKAQEAAERFRTMSTRYIKLYKGVAAFLSALKARGAKLYILSNAQSCFTVSELERLDLSKYFDGVELSSDFGAKKPDASFFKHMLSKYSLNVDESIYVGNDICADLHGARDVNMRSAYVLSNLSPKSDTLDEASKTAVFACSSHKILFEYLLSI